jgi:ribosome-associated protein
LPDHLISGVCRGGSAIANTTTRKRASTAPASKAKAATKSKSTAAAKKPAAAGKAKTVTTKVTKAAAKVAKTSATKSKNPKTTAPKATAKKSAAKSSLPAAVIKLHQLILKSLDDDKAEEIVSIELAGKSSIADFMVIASGRSSRQVAAIAEHLVDRIAKETGKKVRAEGKAVGDWVLIDTGDVVVHIFRPDVRNFYNLEKMWGGATIPEPAAA